MTIEAYAEETIPIEEISAFREKLENLEAETRSHRLEQEAVLCGEKTQVLEGLEHWARKWRKEFELHALTCELRKSAEETRKPAAEAQPASSLERAAMREG